MISIRKLSWMLVTVFLVTAWSSGQTEQKNPEGKAEGEEKKAAPVLEGVKPAQWRLLWTADPATEVIASWSTKEKGTVHRVRFDTKSCGGKVSNYRKTVVCEKNGKFEGKKVELYYHHARLVGLTPSTTYYLTMESDGFATREFHFVTGPVDDRPFSILWGGDSRTDWKARAQVNQHIRKLAAADPSIIAFAHGGDYVMTGDLSGLWSRWMSDHEKTVTEDGRMLPVIPARGNHEAKGNQFDHVFNWPGGGLGKNYFAFKLGSEVFLITLNSETAAGGNQVKFLKKALVAQGKTRWLLAQYHRPIWPAFKAPGRAKPHWLPLFEKHNLDVVLEADGHTLKRTVPIRHEMADPTGVVYLGEGGLGVPPRKPKMDRWFIQSPGMAGSTNHVWKLSFSKEALKAEAILLDGKIADSYLAKPREREKKK